MTDLSQLSDEELDALHAKALASAPAAAPKAPDLSSLSDDELDAMHQKALAAQAKAPPKPGMAESAMRGAAQGASLGFADEAYGALGGGINSLKNDTPFIDEYRKARDYARGKDAAAQAANPKTFTAGTVGGSLLTAVVPGAGALNVGKGATLGTAVAKGAASGGLTGLGMSDADVTKGEVPKAAIDTVKGAALGGAAGGAINIAGKALNPTVMKYLAERKAAKATMGNVGKAWDDAVAAGTVNSDGRQLLDSGVVSFGASPRTIAGRAAAARSAAGSGIGETLGGIDQQMASRFLDTAGEETTGMANGAAIAKRLRDEAANMSGEGNQALVQRLNETADKYEKMGEFPLSQAAKEKKSWTYRSGDAISESQKARNLVKGAIGDEMEDAVGRFDKANPAPAPAAVAEAPALARTGTDGHAVATPATPDAVGQAVAQAGQDLAPHEQEALAQSMRSELGQAGAAAPSPATNPRDLLDRYQAQKQTYGTMDRAKANATKLANRMEKNQSVGLKDAVVAAATPGGIPGKIAAAVGSKVLRERGNSMAAVTADTVAKVLEKTPEAFGKYAPQLLKAAQNGQLGLVHYLLMKKDPGYAAQVQNLQP